MLDSIRNSNPSESITWDNIFDALLDLDPENTAPYHTQMLEVFAYNHAMGVWRSIPRDQKKQLTDAIEQYYSSPAPSAPVSNTPSSSESSEPLTEQGNGNVGGINMTRQQMEQVIFDEFVRKTEEANGSSMQPEDKQRLIADLHGRDITDIKDTVRDIISEYRKKGVQMLDVNGKWVPGC